MKIFQLGIVEGDLHQASENRLRLKRSLNRQSLQRDILAMMYVIWTVVAAVIAAALLYLDYLLNSMREVERMPFEAKLYLRPTWNRICVKLGLIDQFMRPRQLYEATLENGFKLLLPRKEWAVAAKEFYKMKIRENDIFVSTYPKAGTTWTQEIVWLICNNADTTSAKQSVLNSRFPFLETVYLGNNFPEGLKIEGWPKHKQRFIKTHLPFEALPKEFHANKQCKLIYVTRNPKDVCVSMYHFHDINAAIPKPNNWHEFLEKFCSGDVIYGSWFAHVKKYWKEYQENRNQIYFTTYEELTKDLRGQIISMSKFLGKKLTDEQIENIKDHCSFSSMSKNKSTNYSHLKDRGPELRNAMFMRKGKVGDWKNLFTLNENEAFDELFNKEMKGTGLEMNFEL